MPIPGFSADGSLPPGIHAATLSEITERFGIATGVRRRQVGLVRDVVQAATLYPTIKRVLLWGSFVTAKLEPGDVDYSSVVDVNHRRVTIAESHRRFFVPSDARRYYGADSGYVLVADYPLEYYMDRLDFLCRRKDGHPCGIVEIHIRGESIGVGP